MQRRAESKAVLEEYRRARAALLRRLSRARNKGLDLKGFEVPKIPKMITRGSIRAIKKKSEEFTRFKRSIPKYGDVMADLVDNMIMSAQNWIDDHPLSHIKERNEERIRHRGDEARDKFNLYSLAYDEKNRATLQANVVRTWDSLVSRLEVFLLESDQYKYDGNLSELADIFVKMLESTEEAQADAEELANDFVDEHDWIEWEED